MAVDYSIAISTYFNDEILNKGRLEVFKKSITSLVHSNFAGKIFIVDDGSENKSHIDYVDSLKMDNLFLILKKKNGGISRCKNTGIKCILDSGSFYGFLADDDLLYSKDWFCSYLDAMMKTNIKHLSFFSELWEPDIPVQKKKITISYSNYLFNLYSYAQGGMLTFTKDVIDTIGYYKILPYKTGHEHGNFSFRAISAGFSPGFADSVASNDYLAYVDPTNIITTRDADFREKSEVNLKGAGIIGYEPCIE